MKRPPMKKTVTSAVASICDRRSCVRERMSRNVQRIRLSQNMIVKATIKPMTIPSEFVRVVKVLLPEDGGVAVETAVGVAVGVASGLISRIVVRICATCVIAGLMPLSEICIICYLQLQRTRSENGNTIGLIQALVHGNAMRKQNFVPNSDRATTPATNHELPVHSRGDPCGRPVTLWSPWTLVVALGCGAMLPLYKNNIVVIPPARIPTCSGPSSSPLQRSCSCGSSCRFATKALVAATPGRNAASTA